MIKQVIVAIISLLLSLMPLSVQESTLTIVYGIIGVLFSVGMSLIISFNGSNIGNSELKKDIRGNMHNVRKNFLIVFLICSLFFIVYSLLPDKLRQIVWYNNDELVIKSNWSFSVIVYHFYSIIALISNYIDIQQLYEDIEDRIESEKRNGIQ